MKVSSGQVVGVVLMGLGMGSVALGAEDNKVVTAADSTKLGLEFRAEFLRDDNGLTKMPGKKPPITTSEQVQALNVLLDGNLNKDTDYHFRFNLLNPSPATGGPLDYGYGSHWFNKTVGFSIGKMRVLQGGWDTYDQNFTDHWTGAYADNLGFKVFDTVLALHAKLAGVVTVQLVNDNVTPPPPNGGPAGAEWNRKANPTVALGWVGDLGIVKPLIDFGTFDNQKSRYFDVGVKTETNGLTARFDYRNESYSHRVSEAGSDKPKDKSDTANAYTVYAAYNVGNVVTPWGYYSKYDKKQYSSATHASSKADDWARDASGNLTMDASGAPMPVWDANKQVWGVGANLAGPLGKGWTPYLAYVQTTGKFKDPAGTDATVHRTDNQVRLGVLGEF